MDPTIRDAAPGDAAPVAALLTQLGYPSDPDAVEARLDRLRVVGDRVVVAEAHRGHGIGRALVDAVEEEARLRGCELLFLTTSERRDDAHAFYEDVGLEHTGRRYTRTLSE